MPCGYDFGETKLQVVASKGCDSHFAFMIILVACSLFAAAFCLGLGLVLPLLQFQRLYFFVDTPSLWEIIVGLFSNGSAALGLLVLIFSVLFPAVKILALFYHAMGGDDEVSRRLAAFSKWSMLDVLLVALFIFAAKTSGLAAAITQPGVWFFAASTLFAAFASAMLARTKKAGAEVSAPAKNENL